MKSSIPVKIFSLFSFNMSNTYTVLLNRPSYKIATNNYCYIFKYLTIWFQDQNSYESTCMGAHTILQLYKSEVFGVIFSQGITNF